VEDSDDSVSVKDTAGHVPGEDLALATSPAAGGGLHSDTTDDDNIPGTPELVTQK